jgi:hypothetical protein
LAKGGLRYIRREIDALAQQDDVECAAIFDDLELLMQKKGGELYKKGPAGDR